VRASPPAAPEGREEEYREHVASAVSVALGTIASGEKLLRDRAKLGTLRTEMHGKVEAGEMEAAGLVEGCRRSKVAWRVIRGISDFGDELKDDRFHALRRGRRRWRGIFWRGGWIKREGRTEVKVSIAVPLFREWIADNHGTGG